MTDTNAAPAAPPAGDDASASASASASAASEKPLNIGTFDTKDPNARFFRAEMISKIRAISSEKRKAELVMECLPPPCWNVMARFFEEKSSPTYAMVKEEILDHWDTKPAARAKQFFAHLGSSAGDTNISTMYHTLETLTTIPKTTTRSKSALNLVMEMTLQMYPKQVRAQLPDYSTMDYKDFLRQADRILAAYVEPSLLASAAASSSTAVSSAAAAASDTDDEPQHAAAPAQPGRKFNKQPVRRKKKDTCYYHTRFGDKAFRCQPPCRYSKNE